MGIEEFIRSPQPFNITMADPGMIHTHTICRKESAVEEEQLYPSNTQEGVLAYSVELSFTPLDGDFLFDESTEILFSGDPLDKTFSLESRIGVETQSPGNRAFPNRNIDAQESTPYIFRNLPIDGGRTSTSVYDYYANRGIDRIMTILADHGVTSIKDGNVMTIKEGEYSLVVTFGAKGTVEPTIKKIGTVSENMLQKIVPMSLPIKLSDNSSSDISAVLNREDGEALSLADEKKFREALIAYLSLYSYLIRSLYEERGRSPDGQQIYLCPEMDEFDYEDIEDEYYEDENY